MRRYLALVAAASTSGPALALGIMAWAVAAFLALSVGAGGFQPGWGDPLNYALNATTFVAPIAAGSAAHQVAGLGRARLLDLGRTSPRGAGAQVRLAIVATLVWSGAALVSMHAILLLAADRSGARTLGTLLLAAAGVGIVVLCVTAGALCGLVWHSVATAPAVTLVSFTWMYGLVFVDGKIGRLAPIYPDVFYNDAIEPNLLLVSAQVGGMAGLSLLAVAATWRAGTRAALIAVGTLIVAASAVAWHRADPAATQLRNPPASIPCATERSVTLCYWPESSEQARPALGALAEGHDRLRKVVDPPTLFAQRGLAGKVPGARELLLPGHEDPDYGYRAVLAFAPTLTCDDERPAEAYRQLVNLFTALTDAGPVSEDTEPVLEMSESRQRAWVTRRTAIIDECPDAR